MNTATVSVNTTMKQMTGMSQWPNLSAKNDRNVSAKDKNQVGIKLQMRVTFHLHWIVRL